MMYPERQLVRFVLAGYGGTCLQVSDNTTAGEHFFYFFDDRSFRHSLLVPYPNSDVLFEKLVEGIIWILR